MLVLNAKKIRYTVLGIIMLFMIITISLSSKDEVSNYITTVSLPVSERVVVID